MSPWHSAIIHKSYLNLAKGLLEADPIIRDTEEVASFQHGDEHSVRTEFASERLQ